MTDALLSAWSDTRHRRAADGAVFDTGGSIVRRFADIEAEAAQFAAELEFAPGTVIALQLGNHPSWPALLLACLRRELVVLPLERSITKAELETAGAICQVAAIFEADSSGSVRLTKRSANEIDWGERPPVLLKLTSGTTAAPRAIRFRSAQLVADCTQICDTMGITEHDVNFGVIPVSHSYGFSNLITPLLVRGVPMVLSQDRMPRAVLEQLAGTGATVFPGMPVFYQAFSKLALPPKLPALRLCISAGAPLPLTVAQRFRDRFGLAIHSFYGSSECGGICYDRSAALAEPGVVGEAMEGVELDLLEPDSVMSRVRVRTAAAGDGYFPDPDPARLGDGVFVPDDLLARGSDGYRIVGRASDVINVAGKKVNPAEVEAALLAFTGIQQAVVFGRGSLLRNEEVAACVVADASVEERALLDFCRHRLSGWQVPKRIFFLSALPVTERGKISRRALAERFAD